MNGYLAETLLALYVPFSFLMKYNLPLKNTYNYDIIVMDTIFVLCIFKFA